MRSPQLVLCRCPVYVLVMLVFVPLQSRLEVTAVRRRAIGQALAKSAELDASLDKKASETNKAILLIACVVVNEGHSRIESCYCGFN